MDTLQPLKPFTIPNVQRHGDNRWFLLLIKEDYDKEANTLIPMDLFTADEENAINEGKLITALVYNSELAGRENVFILF